MSESRQWIVRIGGRVERVTDDPRFPTLFVETLTSDPAITLVRFQQHPWPHANSADILISATTKKDAEIKGRDIMKRILKLAGEAFGVERYGWVVSVGAESVSGRGQS